MSAQVPEGHFTLHAQPNTPISPGTKPESRSNIQVESMDGRQPAYQQPGLTSSYPQSLQEQDSETSPADQGSPSSTAAAAAAAAAAHYGPGQEGRPPNFSSATTPASEYGMNPSSTRSASFPDYGGGAAAAAAAAAQHQQRYHSAAASQAGVGGGDPSIAAQTSPTYPPPGGQYSPYTPQHDMSHFSPHSGTPGIFQRPEWSGSYPHHQPPHHLYGSPSVTTGAPSPAMVSPVARPPGGGHPLSTVYSFVPIPGAQQQKRPRRRYEEIERMYKCGWDGCDKAYGTLNHLNAHVTMQSHGQKRTPEEFKEIRKEWKIKKKEEEAARKSEEDRRMQAHARAAAEAGGAGGPPGGPGGAGGPADQNMYGQMRPHVSGPGGAQLPPPLGYAAAQAATTQSGAGVVYGPPQTPIESMAQYANSQMYGGGSGGGSASGPSGGAGGNGNGPGPGPGYPQSPYGPGGQVYQQHPDQGPGSYQQ